MAQVVLNKLVDVRVDSGQTLTATHDAVVGGANVVRQPFQATTATSSNMDFVIQTPGLGQFVSRRVDIVGQIPWQVTVTCNVVDTGTPLVITQGYDVGIEAWPMNSLITAATVQISTSSFTTQLQQIMPLMKRILRNSDKRNKVSMTPTSVGSTAILYRNGVVPYPQGPFAGTVGREEDSFGNAGPRGRLRVLGYTVQYATAGPGGIITPGKFTMTGTLDIDEPLLCQPFKMDDETMAFINTNLIQIRLNLSPLGAELARVLRFASRPYGPVIVTAGTLQLPDLVFSDLTIDTSQTSLLRNFSVWATFISPPGGAQVPPSTIYDTVYYNPLPTADAQAITFNTSVTVSSNTITLNTAPDLVAVYYVPNLPTTNDGRVDWQYSPISSYPSGGKGYCREDTLGEITKLNVTWNNNPSLFATFDQQELYRRSAANGLSVPYCGTGVLHVGTVTNMASGQPNSLTKYFPWGAPGTTTELSTPAIQYPMLLALNKDIPVEPNVAAGVAGVFTLKVTATVRNVIDYAGITGGTLYVVPITSQYLKLNSGAMSDIIATVATEADVYRTPVIGDVQSKELVGAGRSRASADSHAVASSRHGLGRLLSGGGARGGGMPDGGAGGGGAGGNPYLGAKRSANLMLM